MGEGEPGLRPVAQHLGDENLQIALILREVVDMALARVGEFALRAGLAAPIERHHVEAATAQLLDRLEIFFDEFIVALKQRHRAARTSAAGKCGGAQSPAVPRLQGVNGGALGDRVAGRRDKFSHGISSALQSRIFAPR